MTARTLPGADVEFDEFIKSPDGKSFDGDCGEFAEISAVHIVTGLSLTAANLHTIVNRDIDHKWADTNGGEPLVSIAHDLDTLKLLYTLYNYPGPANWMDIIKSEAGIQPVIMELANGQNLAGDETNLHFHFICIVGIDSNGNFLCCDGDNVRRDAEHLLAVYTPTMIEGAQPCGLIVVRYPQKDDFGYTVEADGTIVYNKTGIHLIGFIAQFVREHNIQEECLFPETYYDGSSFSVTPFTNNIILVYDAVDKAIQQNLGGEVITKLLNTQKAASPEKATS
jgi:hypothetical protein